MHLLDLPDELLVKISWHLKNNQRDFINFYSCSKRFIEILSRLDHQYAWLNYEPFTLKFCVIRDNHTKCFDRRTKILADFKYVKFGTITFEENLRYDEKFRSSLQRLRSTQTWISIEKIILTQCSVDMACIHELLKESNVNCLQIHDCYYHFDETSYPFCALKVPLRHLILSGNLTFKLCDLEFKYFVLYVPAENFELTISKCVMEPIIIHRFYKRPHDYDGIIDNPSPHIFSSTMVLQYLLRHRLTLKVFRLANMINNIAFIQCILMEQSLLNLILDLRTTRREYAQQNRTLIELLNTWNPCILTRILF